MNERFLELSSLGKSFDGPSGPQVVVEGFDLRLREGEFVSLVGHSGCGKSTVLAMVAGLSRSDTGGILLADREVREPGPDRGMVFQSPCLFPWMSALDNVLIGVEQVRPRASKSEQREIAMRHLSSVGLADVARLRPQELSAGMRQRVGLARAFALSPKVLLLDEPFGMLDSITRMELEDVLLEVWAEHRITALMVTHDVDEAMLLSDRVVMMTSGPRAHVGEILEMPFERPRDRHALLESPTYYALRERIIGLLEAWGGHGPPALEAEGGSAALEPIGGGISALSGDDVQRVRVSGEG